MARSTLEQCNNKKKQTQNELCFILPRRSPRDKRFVQILVTPSTTRIWINSYIRFLLLSTFCFVFEIILTAYSSFADGRHCAAQRIERPTYIVVHKFMWIYDCELNFCANPIHHSFVRGVASVASVESKGEHAKCVNKGTCLRSPDSLVAVDRLCGGCVCICVYLYGCIWHFACGAPAKCVAAIAERERHETIYVYLGFVTLVIYWISFSGWV